MSVQRPIACMEACIPCPWILSSVHSLETQGEGVREIISNNWAGDFWVYLVIDEPL